jgi:hypothetical protein
MFFNSKCMLRAITA